MRLLVVAVPLLIIAPYVVVAVRVIPHVLAGGVRLRDVIHRAIALGPLEVLSLTYRSTFILLIGIVVSVVGINSYATYLAYQAAPICRSVPQAECRAVVDLEVSSVKTQRGRFTESTVVYFNAGYGPATFSADDLSPNSLSAESGVTAEVWRGQVTALRIAGVSHQSFATQSDAWIPIAAGLGLLLFGATWLFIDLALEALGPTSGIVTSPFVEPVLRRRALYVLLPIFGALLGIFGLAYVAIWFGSLSTAATFAAIYFLGGLVVVPVLVLVFVSWAVRAYVNVTALGMEARHSGWFVLAAFLLPPLSLYMPHKLLSETVQKTNANVSDRLLMNWWICGIIWICLTVIGLTLGSSSPTDASLTNQLSNVMLVGSVLVGVFGAYLTVLIVRAVDTAELAIARGTYG